MVQFSDQFAKPRPTGSVKINFITLAGSYDETFVFFLFMWIEHVSRVYGVT